MKGKVLSELSIFDDGKRVKFNLVEEGTNEVVYCCSLSQCDGSTIKTGDRVALEGRWTTDPHGDIAVTFVFDRFIKLEG